MVGTLHKFIPLSLGECVRTALFGVFGSWSKETLVCTFFCTCFSLYTFNNGIAGAWNVYIFNFSRYHKMFFFFMTFKLGHGVGLWVLSPNIYIIASDRPWSQCRWHGWGLSVSLSSNCHPELKWVIFFHFKKYAIQKRDCRSRNQPRPYIVQIVSWKPYNNYDIHLGKRGQMVVCCVNSPRKGCFGLVLQSRSKS